MVLQSEAFGWRLETVCVAMALLSLLLMGGGPRHPWRVR